MDEVLQALENILDKASDEDIMRLDKELRAYGIRYFTSRMQMRGGLEKVFDQMEDTCGYRLTCRACNGDGKHATLRDTYCAICEGEGRMV